MTSIAVRDLETGERAGRPADTLTIDVPLNFVPGREFTVADGFRAQYTAAGGGNVVCKVATRPLSWRAQGETCLVARTGAARRVRRYRLCRIVPNESRAVG
jgi:hypothetical protein